MSIINLTFFNLYQCTCVSYTQWSKRKTKYMYNRNYDYPSTCVICRTNNSNLVRRSKNCMLIDYFKRENCSSF